MPVVLRTRGRKSVIRRLPVAPSALRAQAVTTASANKEERETIDCAKADS